MLHSLSADNGYTASLELESKLPENTVEDLVEEHRGHHLLPRQKKRDGKDGNGGGTEQTE